MNLMQQQNQPVFGVILTQQCQQISENCAATLTSNAKVEDQTKENLQSIQNHVWAFLTTSDRNFQEITQTETGFRIKSSH